MILNFTNICVCLCECVWASVDHITLVEVKGQLVEVVLLMRVLGMELRLVGLEVSALTADPSCQPVYVM